MASNMLFMAVILFKSNKNMTLLLILCISIIYSTLICIFLNNVDWIFADEAFFKPNNLLNLGWFSRMRLIFNRQTNKNVYYGELSGREIVIKEYPYSSMESCRGLNIERCVEKFEKFVSNFRGPEMRNLILCPTTKKINLLWNLTTEIDFEKLTEHLLLQILPVTDGWPVPTYIGTWSNVLIEEYVGPTLSAMNAIPWRTRMWIAMRLLKLAEIFTFQHPTFSFYFTDLTPDNIALADNMEPVLVDLDHVIIVDRSVSNDSELPFWGTVHVSEIFEEGDSFTFSTEDICYHHLSDLNYFSVCQHILMRSNILGEGLLEKIPERVDKLYLNLKDLVQECAQPKNMSDRILAGRLLGKLLERILREGGEWANYKKT